MSGASLSVLDFGRSGYESVLGIQYGLVEKRKAGEIPDTLVLVEHEPVYTTGRNIRRENILADPARLAELGLKVVETDRGGDVTFHGPGQVVGYPVINLAERGLGVVSYVGLLESLLIRTLADFGVKGHSDRKNRGVWVGNEKIAAIGVRVTRRVTMHGFAFNVCVDLNYYRHIVPCGIRDKGVTSLNRLVKGADMEKAKERIIINFCGIFGYEGHAKNR